MQTSAPRRARGQADLLAGVARRRVERQVGADLAPQRDRVHGDHRARTCQPRELQGHQADGAHPEHGHGVPDTHVSVAHGAEREVGGVETGSRLPGHALRKHPYLVGPPDVLLAEPAVREHPVAPAQVGDGAAGLDHFADAHVPQYGGIVLRAAGIVDEDAQLVVVAAARTAVALVQRHLRAVLGGPEFAAYPDLLGRQRLARVVAERDPLALGCYQFSWHGDYPLGMRAATFIRSSLCSMTYGDMQVNPLAAIELQHYDLVPPITTFVLPAAGTNNTTLGIRTGAGQYVRAEQYPLPPGPHQRHSGLRVCPPRDPRAGCRLRTEVQHAHLGARGPLDKRSLLQPRLRPFRDPCRPRDLGAGGYHDPA